MRGEEWYKEAALKEAIKTIPCSDSSVARLEIYAGQQAQQVMTKPS